MPVIDQTLTWKAVEARLATETDPVLRRNLETLLTHMKAEAALDLERLMATVSERAAYHQYVGNLTAPTSVGKDGVRKFYEDFAASGAGRLHHDIDRLVVDRDCILTDGTMRIAYPGRRLAEMGIDVDDPDALYLYETRMAVVWPIDEHGLFIGEDAYVGGDGFDGIADRKIDPADIVVARPDELVSP
jgi:hypothetical protein